MRSVWGRGAVFVVAVALVVAGGVGAFSFLGMSSPGQVALTILLVAALLWVSEAVPLFVTSFVILAMCLTWLRGSLAAAGKAVNGDTFTEPFFSNIILLFLGGFVLSASLHKFRYDEQLARMIIDRTGGHIPKLMLGVMAITAFLSMWLSNTATTAMMLTLVLPIVAALPAGDAYRKAILLAIPFAANVGGLGTPIGSPPNAIALQYMQQAGGAPTFTTWMLLGVPGVIVMLALIWGVLMLLFRGKVAKVELPGTTGGGGDSKSERLVADRPAGGWLVLAVGGVTVFGWVSGAWHGIASGTVALLPVLVLFGLKVLDIRDLRALPWDVLLVMGGGLCLGSAIEVSGLADWIVGRLPTDGLGQLGLIAVFSLVAAIMSGVMSNTAAANLIMPIALGLGVTGYAPLMIGVAFACSLAMPLPISTPPNAIAFSSGELTVKDMVVPGLIITFLGLALALTTGYWWWGVVGLF